MKPSDIDADIYPDAAARPAAAAAAAAVPFFGAPTLVDGDSDGLWMRLLRQEGALLPEEGDRGAVCRDAGQESDGQGDTDRTLMADLFRELTPKPRADTNPAASAHSNAAAAAQGLSLSQSVLEALARGLNLDSASTMDRVTSASAAAAYAERQERALRELIAAAIEETAASASVASTSAASRSGYSKAGADETARDQGEPGRDARLARASGPFSVASGTVEAETGPLRAGGRGSVMQRVAAVYDSSDEDDEAPGTAAGGNWRDNRRAMKRQLTSAVRTTSMASAAVSGAAKDGSTSAKVTGSGKPSDRAAAGREKEPDLETFMAMARAQAEQQRKQEEEASASLIPECKPPESVADYAPLQTAWVRSQTKAASVEKEEHQADTVFTETEVIEEGEEEPVAFSVLPNRRRPAAIAPVAATVSL
jgi:hypothetical protein